MPRQKKVEAKKFFTGTGRRKRAVASVWLYAEKGDFTVNGTLLKDHFVSKNAELALELVRPFHAVGVSHPQAKFSATVKVYGGGSSSQIEAIRLAFARALMAYDPTFRPVLRSNNLLTRDSREVERKKPFLSKARKRPQYSKR